MRWIQVGLESVLNARIPIKNVFIACRYHFEVVCEQTGISTRLHDIESSKRSQTQLVAAIDLCDGHETELLLCYNRKPLTYIID